MNLSKYFEALYLKVFVNIVIGKDSNTIYIEVLSNHGTITDSGEEKFEGVTLTHKMIEFIESFTRETPFYYVSILDSNSFQGANVSCDGIKDNTPLKHLCYKDIWNYYTPKTNLTTISKDYEEVGVDFIFSPFVLLSHFFKDKTSEDLTMYVLVNEAFLTLTIMNHSELLYAQHIEMIEDEGEGIDTLDLGVDLDDDEDDENDFSNIEDMLDSDDGDIGDDTIDLDDFGDIEDLDSLDEIEEFAEEEEIVQEEEIDDVVAEDIDGFNQNYQRYSMIQDSVNDYYNDPRYDRQFVQTIYIADGVDIGGDLKKYLEDEMFMEVHIRRLDLCVELCELAKMELE